MLHLLKKIFQFFITIYNWSMKDLICNKQLENNSVIPFKLNARYFIKISIK